MICLVETDMPNACISEEGGCKYRAVCTAYQILYEDNAIKFETWLVKVFDKRLENCPFKGEYKGE